MPPEVARKPLIVNILLLELKSYLSNVPEREDLPLETEKKNLIIGKNTVKCKHFAAVYLNNGQAREDLPLKMAKTPQ